MSKAKEILELMEATDRELAKEVVVWWEEQGLHVNDLKQDKLIKKAIKDYQVQMGIKLPSAIARQIKTIAYGDE